jgi:hypothetical protein
VHERLCRMLLPFGGGLRVEDVPTIVIANARLSPFHIVEA